MRQLPRPPKFSAQALEQVWEWTFKPEVRRLVAEANTEYHHWEKFRHRPVPEGLTPEKAWYAVKLSRLGQKRDLPFKDESGRLFGYWLPNPALETLHEIDRWGGTSLALAGGPAKLLD